MDSRSREQSPVVNLDKSETKKDLQVVIISDSRISREKVNSLNIVGNSLLLDLIAA